MKNKLFFILEETVATPFTKGISANTYFL